MTRKLLFFIATFLCLQAANKESQAQVIDDIYELPDTVCTDHEIEPYDIVENARTYNWTFCPPNLAIQPIGQNMGPFTSVSSPAAFVATKDDNGRSYTFHINNNGIIIRMNYEDGLRGAPSFIREVGQIQRSGAVGGNVGGGLYAVHDGTKQYLFAVGGTNNRNSNLARFEFGNGLIQQHTKRVDLGTLDGQLSRPTQLFIAKEGNTWYGFTFNVANNGTAELIRLDFGSSLENEPTVTNIGNIENKFYTVRSLTGIQELGNWHLFITCRNSSSIQRISFGNSFLNTPYVIDFGNLQDLAIRPIGLSITRDCDKYYGYALCEGNTNLVTLIWNNSIADTPTATNMGNPAGFHITQVLSNTIRDDGSMFLFSTNNHDNSISRIEFPSCTQSDIAYKDQRLPPTFKYSEPGTYTVKLTIDEGMPTVRTECVDIVVYDHPPMTISEDTLICDGDTLRLEMLVFQPDSILWYPNYNIDTTKGSLVKVWPTMNTQYFHTTYFNKNCVVRKPINVNVSKIAADAGPDRKLSDGTTTVLGGPGTTIGEDYTYFWSPEIGIVGNRYLDVTTAEPPYSITYYLEVTNSDGCYAIDSVNVSVACDNVYLPNAFSPLGSNPQTNTFGFSNHQFSKLNSFSIYDRWGNQVFTTTDLNQKWDGKYKGVFVPFGVYVWEVDANCANSFERFRKSGNVTVIR